MYTFDVTSGRNLIDNLVLIPEYFLSSMNFPSQIKNLTFSLYKNLKIFLNFCAVYSS